MQFVRSSEAFGDRAVLAGFDHLSALYESVVPKIQSEDAARQEFEKARSDAHSILKGPGSNNALRRFESSIRRMELALTVLLPPEFASRQLDRYRIQYRELLGEQEYGIYESRLAMAGPPDPVVETTFILGELSRYQQMRERAERVRSYLLGVLSSATIGLFAFTILPFVLFLIDVYFRDIKNPPLWYLMFAGSSELNDHPGSLVVTRLAILSVAISAGVLGAHVSASNRIQRLTLDRDLAKNASTLVNSSAQIRYVPYTGGVFALILLFIFSGGLVQGQLFPEFDYPEGSSSVHFIMYDSLNLSKLAVWSFIAGFSERFVPDILDRLVNRHNDKGSDNSPQPLGPLPTPESKASRRLLADRTDVSKDGTPSTEDGSSGGEG